MNPYGATVAKQRLSRRLRELREPTRLTADRVGDRLGWGRGKVGRIENNVWKRPELSDIRDLLRFYGLGDAERRELEELALLARRRSWWRDYPDVFGETEFPGFEADAARICCYMPLILPGLLQTPAYTEAQMRVGAHPPEWRARALAARQRRQEILARADGTAPELMAVISEASLLYRWGAAPDRAAQLRHLSDASSRLHIELRLLRFAAGMHPGMCGPINIFDFPGGDPPMVYLETDFTIQSVPSLADIAAYIETFERIRRAALDPAETTAYLAALADG
ncbi:MAG: helix-turn-helix domain-containing protein [Natronosporangium sp.]